MYGTYTSIHSTILDPPTNISIGVITKNSVSINFKDPSGNGNVMTYIPNIGSLTGNTSPFIISGLTSDTNYTSITVKTSTYYTGTTTIGYSIPTSIPSFITLTQPQVITSVTPTQVTYNSVLYKVYTFKSNNTMQFKLSTPIPIYIFMVGGGGSGGKGWTYTQGGVEVIAGGGGAGGVFQTNTSGITLSSSTTFNITIGIGGINTSIINGTPTNGTNTIFTNSIIKYTAGGGGYGGGYNHPPSSGIGGSSGGWNRTTNNTLSGSVSYPSSIQFQINADTSNNLHYNGGTAYSGSSTAAGGGGAGGIGSNGEKPGGDGKGGPGIIPSNPIFGTDTFACGGYGTGDNGTLPVNNVNDALNSGNGGGILPYSHPYYAVTTKVLSGFNGICKIAVRASDFI